MNGKQPRPRTKRRILPWILASAVVLLLAGYLARGPMLTALGSYMVQAGPPMKADIVLVPAGDFAGNRIRKAAELVRQGFASQVLVSGPAGMYGSYECDLAIAYAVNAGFPESYFIHFENHALSTREEAEVIVPELRRRGIQDVLLVTSNYHTRRAGYNYRRIAPDLNFNVVAVKDPDFTPETWWHSREGQKRFLYEGLKTVATWFGI